MESKYKETFSGANLADFHVIIMNTINTGVFLYTLHACIGYLHLKRKNAL